MNFYNFYVFILFFTENLWRVNCSADFDVIELEHLSDKLHPTECLRLLNAIYPPTLIDSGGKLSDSTSQTSENCQTKLKEWNRTFPEKERARARAKMEVILRHTLKKPELANYVKRGRRLMKFLNELTNPVGEQHDNKYLLRRHAIKDSDIPVKKKKKPKTTKKSPLLLSESGAHALNTLSTPQENSDYSGKKVPKQAKAATYQESEKTRSSEELDNSDSGTSTHWIALIIVLLFIISVIIVIIAVTLLKNRNNLLNNSSRRGCDDLCPLKEHFQKLPSDVEHGWSTSTTDYAAATGRWRRESSIPSSRSPSRSLFCSKGKKPTVKRKSKIKKFKDNQQQTLGVKNKRTSKDTKSKKNRKVSIDKTRKSREISVRDKIGHILRKDKRDCKCCQCANVDEEDDDDDDAHGVVCADNHCKQRRILNLRDFVLPESKDLKKVKKLTRKKSKKEDSARGIIDSSSLENSPRKREEFRLKEKFKTKEKSPRSSLVVPCNRETCELRKTPRGVT